MSAARNHSFREPGSGSARWRSLSSRTFPGHDASLKPAHRIVARTASRGHARSAAARCSVKWVTRAGISSMRSRSGGTSIATTFKPVQQVLPKAAFRRSRSPRSLLVAARTRTSTLDRLGAADAA